MVGSGFNSTLINPPVWGGEGSISYDWFLRNNRKGRGVNSESGWNSIVSSHTVPGVVELQ